MAQSLIESLANDFDPDAFEDEYAKALSDLVEAKLEGAPLAPAAEVETAASTEVVDLLTALQRSVERARAGRSGDDAAAAPAEQAGAPVKRAARGSTAKKAAPAAEAAAPKAPAKRTAAKKAAAKEPAAKAAAKTASKTVTKAPTQTPAARPRRRAPRRRPPRSGPARAPRSGVAAIDLPGRKLLILSFLLGKELVDGRDQPRRGAACTRGGHPRPPRRGRPDPGPALVLVSVALGWLALGVITDLRIAWLTTAARWCSAPPCLRRRSRGDGRHGDGVAVRADVVGRRVAPLVLGGLVALAAVRSRSRCSSTLTAPGTRSPGRARSWPWSCWVAAADLPGPTVGTGRRPVMTEPRFDGSSTRAPGSRSWACSAADWVDFSFLRDELRLSDSALSKQLSTLQDAGYVVVDRDSSGQRRRVRARLTAAGRGAFKHTSPRCGPSWRPRTSRPPPERCARRCG